MFKRILLPLDGSKFSETAFETGVNLAKQLGASIIITHIVDQTMFENILAPVPGGPVEMAKPIYEDIQAKSEVFLKQKLELCRERGVEGQSILKMGHPVNTIIDLANEMKVDLIVIGSHGRARLGALTLGSVAYGVIHKSQDIAVLVVR
jgi:nucleotide-binding universal stress UspA family protein